VADGEVIGGRIGKICVLVSERRVRVANDLAVPMVLHHDDEDVVEMRYTSIAVVAGEHRDIQ
jgi:hypothetical protein